MDKNSGDKIVRITEKVNYVSTKYLANTRKKTRKSPQSNKVQFILRLSKLRRNMQMFPGRMSGLPANV